ncbi:MAG: glycosyltransferase family 39 protein [PVC group bacterium]
MKSWRSVYLAVLIIFAIALSLRLAFVFSFPRVLWCGDSLSYWNRGEEAASAPVTWESLKITLLENVRKGPVYPLFIAAVIRIWGENLAAVLVIQALLDAGSCSLLFLLGRSLATRRAGLLAGLMAALYTPFIFSASFVLQETLTVFFLVLTVFLIVRALDKKSVRLFVAAGIVSGFLMLCREAMLLLPPCLLLSIAAAVWSREKRWRPVLAFAGGMLVIALTWYLVIALISPKEAPREHARVGHFTRSSVINYLETDGWVPDAPPSTPPITSGVLSLVFSGACLKAFLMNAGRFWAYPFNIYWPSLILTDHHLVLLQRALVLCALIGIPLLLRTGRKALILLVPPLYITVLTSIFHAETRYNIPAMPFAILLAAVALDRMLAGLIAGRRRCLPPIIALVLLSAGALIFTLPVLVGIPGMPGPSAARLVRLAVLNLWLLGALWFLYSLFSVSAGKKTALLTIVFLLVSGALIINFSALTNRQWHRWTARLSGPEKAIGLDFIFPDDFNPDRYFNPTLLLDVREGPGGAELCVAAPGRVLEVPQPDDMGWLYRKVCSLKKMDPGTIRRWLEIPLDTSLLRDNRLSLTIWADRSSKGLDGYVEVGGDYYLEGNENFFEGPALPLSSDPDFLTSCYKWIVDWDRRLERRTPLEAGEVRSTMGGQEDADLAPARGLQTGRYRIRLRLSKVPGPVLARFREIGPGAYVRGVDTVVQAPEYKKKYYRDFLTPESKTTPGYLMRASSSPPEMTWETGRCGARKRTFCDFIGNVSREPGLILLSVNGREALTFSTGTGGDRRWEERGYALTFDFKEEIFSSKKYRESYSGIYTLSVPPEAVEPGRPLTITARFISGSPESWFLIKQFSPHERIEYVYF